ncbi:MAG: 4-(cytidine 5'-diphospho)-2-C-methyl-D-erythritol kinase [Clostridia bacterium]|nr:4-(cytidine 5'-diphospho)-2-C-methyl-D-erythritol kinase [Clostridia bacterium]
MTVTVNAPAKVNLTLNIDGVREDGYHLLSSVFQTVSLSDVVTITRTEESGIRLLMSDPLLPCDARNTAYRAAVLFFDYIDKTPCVDIYVEKRIPQQAGLGGGSADAAGVLVGLNALFDAHLSMETLCAIGEKVGADVPFCIVGGTALVTGIGERIEPLPYLEGCPMVIAKPSVGVSTKEAYAAVDAVQTTSTDNDAMCRSIAASDIEAVGALLDNAFEQALAIPEVRELLDLMSRHSPYGCTMSGSGSAVFGLFRTDEQADLCAEALRQHGIAEVFRCAPISCGATVIKRS